LERSGKEKIGQKEGESKQQQKGEKKNEGGYAVAPNKKPSVGSGRKKKKEWLGIHSKRGLVGNISQRNGFCPKQRRKRSRKTLKKKKERNTAWKNQYPTKKKKGTVPNVTKQ